MEGIQSRQETRAPYHLQWRWRELQRLFSSQLPSEEKKCAHGTMMDRVSYSPPEPYDLCCQIFSHWLPIRDVNMTSLLSYKKLVAIKLGYYYLINCVTVMSATLRNSGTIRCHSGTCNSLLNALVIGKLHCRTRGGWNLVRFNNIVGNIRGFYNPRQTNYANYVRLCITVVIRKNFARPPYCCSVCVYISIIDTKKLNM